MVLYQPDTFLHGGDYNPDQWLEYPEILEADLRLMREAHVNAVSVGIFSWALLEPEEGCYDFSWLDDVMDKLTENGISIVLATPSGARPAWMAQKYPEVLRCEAHFQRRHFGERHNHCLTSPVYREKTRQMDRALASHYAGHPGIKLWHIGNEFSGDCYCPLCAEAFRSWLKAKYGTLDELNRRWWTNFWSQRYTDWSQIEPPSEMGEISNPAMKLDWRRFETAQCVSFIEMEKQTVQSITPDIPVTTNLMERFRDYDYFALAKVLDIVSWDSYPAWCGGDDLRCAANTAMQHDLMRSLKKQPFLLMESTPSLVNWQLHNKLKRPGVHLLSSMQAIAHGSQSVMMFQWRKGRGGAESFHGAVVSHDGRGDTRVFRDVRQVGDILKQITPVLQAETQAQVCILFDYENLWALEEVQAAQRGNMRYVDTVLMFYQALWEMGIAVDFVDMAEDNDFSAYQLVIAPMLFLFRNGIEQRLEAYTAQGGVLLTTFFTGIVDENHLAYLGDAPHGLTEVLGLRAVELDALYPQDQNELIFSDGKCCELAELCELPADVQADTVGWYGADFYSGVSCLTRNQYGKGTAWYLAAKPNQMGIQHILQRVTADLSLTKAWEMPLPEGVIATQRGSYCFLQNYSGKEQRIPLPQAAMDLITGKILDGNCLLPAHSVVLFKKKRS